MEVGWKYLVLILSALSSQVFGEKKDFANNVLQCAKRTHLDSCLRSTLEDLRALMPVGFPELGLGPSEPLKINNLKFQSKPGLGAVQVDTKFTNVIVEGLSNFITEDIHADIQTRTLRLAIAVPRVYIKGIYNAKGTVIVLQLEGNGPFEATFFDVLGTGFGRIVPVGPPNNRSLSIRDTNIDFRIGKVNITLYNLFNGDLDILADRVNDFLNSHSQLIIDEVKPQIKLEVNKLLQVVLAEAISKLQVEEFLNQLPPQSPVNVPRSNRSLQQHRNTGQSRNSRLFHQRLRS